MAEQDTTWLYPLTSTTQNSSAGRSNCRKPASYRLIGADGTLEGAIRPFPGFVAVHQFDETTWDSESSGTHNTTSQIVDLFPINFIVGEDGYAFGFVYRVRRASGATGSTACDIFIDYWNSKTGMWVRSSLIKGGVPLPPDLDTTGGRQMSVSVWGRFVYVFVTDSEPASFTLLREAPWTEAVVTNTGPGLRPTLTSPGMNAALGFSLGDMTAIDDAERPAVGQVILTEFTPYEAGPDILWPAGFSGTGSEDASGTGYGQENANIEYLNPGDYAFAYVLYDSSSGRRSSLSEIAQARYTDFDPDASGPLVPVLLYAAIEICFDSVKYDQAYVYRSVRVQDAGGTYVAGVLHLDRILDLNDYRTVNNPLATGPGAAEPFQSIYWYELQDKQLVYQDTFVDRTVFDANMPKGGCSLWYENTMLVSNIRQSSSVSSEEEIRSEDAIRGAGELRWSSLTEVSPEMFSPKDRYYPAIPSNDIISMRQVGANVIGWSLDRQFHIRKESSYLKVQEIHEGFGVVNSKCAETVGSVAYYLTTKGLKSTDSQAQLDDVKAIDEIVIDDWRLSLTSVSMAFDPAMSALFVFNPEEGEACIFWLNTSKVTMVRDMPFRQVCRGSWPLMHTLDTVDLENNEGANTITYRNTLVERAFFVMNSPKETASEAISGFKHQVFVADWHRVKYHTSGLSINDSEETLLPVAGDVIFEVGTAFSGTNPLTLSVGGGLSLSDDLYNRYIYVLKAADPSLVGEYAVIKRRASASTVTLTEATKNNLSGLVEGDVVGISPVYFEWQGGPVNIQQEGGVVYGAEDDFFTVRHMNSVAAAFHDVNGEALTRDSTLCRFRALAFRGNRAEPTVVADTRDTGGNLIQSVKEDTGPNWASFSGSGTVVQYQGKHGISGNVLSPGVRIICPDLDFRLASVMVTGRVRDSKRLESA